MAGDLVLFATEVEGEYATEFKDEDDDDEDGDGIRDDDDEDDDDRDEFEIVGLVTEVLGDTAFLIGSIEVRHGSGTEFSGGTEADIAVGVRVEAEGDLIAPNVLNADEIEFEANEAEISGIVNSVDVDAELIEVMGITVDVSRSELEDSEGDIEPFMLSNLDEGDFVEVEGTESNNVVMAEEVERDEADDSEISGLLDEFDATARTVTLFGQTISTDEMTQYEIDDERVDAETFSRSPA